MAATPRFKIYSADNEYLAACKRPEEAACLVAFLGNGSTIRDGHNAKSTVWHEGHESQSAAESYDHVAECINFRLPPF